MSARVRPDATVSTLARVSALRLRERLKRAGATLVVSIALTVLLSAVVAHHSAAMDVHAMPAAAICLAVLTAAAIIVAGVRVVQARRERRVPIWVPRAPQIPFLAPCGVPARAGPALYLRHRVLRR